jgi:hypothetical protein
MPDRLRPWLALVTATALFGTGCAGLVAQPQVVAVDLGRPELQQFEVVSARTSLERDNPEPRSGSREVTPKLFWSGIGIGTIGAVGTIGFAVAGRVAKDRLNGMYADGSATLEDRDHVRDRGELWNKLAITSGVLMVLGYTVAIISYGVDWHRCGPMTVKKPRCRAKASQSPATD